MNMMRRLLYNRGLDNAYYTYVTDYVNGILFFAYAVVFVTLTVRDKLREKSVSSPPKKSSKKETKSRKTNAYFSFFGTHDVKEISEAVYQQCIDEDAIKQHRDALASLNKVVVLLFVSAGVMNLLGGFAHHYVQLLDDVYESVQFPQPSYSLVEMQDLVSKTVTSLETLQPWYWLWEIANFSGCVMGISVLLLIPYSLATEATKFKNEFLPSKPYLRFKERISTSMSGNSFFPQFKHGQYTLLGYKCDVKVVSKIFKVFAFLFILACIVYHCSNLYTYQENLQSDSMILETLHSIVAIEDSEVHFSTESNLHKFQLAFSNFQHVNMRKLWQIQLTAITLMASIFVYGCFSSYMVWTQLRKRHSNRERTHHPIKKTYSDDRLDAAESNVKEDHDVLFRNRSNRNYEKEPTPDVAEHRNSSKEATEHCKDHQLPIHPNYLSIHFCNVSTLRIWTLRCAGSWLTLAGGLIHVILSSKCSYDDAFDTLGCPLPDSFNHNSVYHIGLGLGMSLIFLAEMIRYFRKFVVSGKTNA